MYGMLFSIKSFVSKISPIDTKEGFLFYKTNKYALHYMETLSGLKFVLNTDNLSTGAKEFMQQMYSKVCVLYKNIQLIEFTAGFVVLSVYRRYGSNTLCEIHCGFPEHQSHRTCLK
jgi:hypothetical protein